LVLPISFKGAPLSIADNNNPESGFGANEWLVAEMYGQWLQNPDSVDRSWWPILERFQLSQQGVGAQSNTQQAAPTSASPTLINTDSTVVQKFDSAAAQTEAITVPVAKTTEGAPLNAPVPADLPATGSIQIVTAEAEEQPEINILRGMAKTLASNMDASLSIPTATSVRQIPAKLLIDNRIVLNSHLKRTRGGKVSFTHIIGYAVVQALKEFPSQNVYYDEVDGKPASVAPAHINFGLAIDIPKPDGTRALLVPNIKRAESLNFSEFVSAYESLVKFAKCLL